MVFLFGKLEFKEKEGFETKDFFKKGLEAKKDVSHDKFYWSFVDLDEIPHEKKSGQKTLLTGYLTKYRDIKDKTVDVQEKEIVDTPVKYHVEAKARFFLEKNSGSIAFSPTVNRLGVKQFCDVFAKIFREVHHKSIESIGIKLGKSSIEVARRIEKYHDIKKEMKELDNIKKISVTLWPSNPWNFKLWERINKKLKKLKVKKLQATYENEDNSLAPFVSGNEIMASIAMTIWGYGTAEILGELGGREKTTKIKEQPIEEEEEDLKELDDKNFTTETSPELILEELKPEFTEFINKQKQ